MSIVVNKTRLPVTEWQTESGSVVSISDARKRYAKSLSVALEPIQSGSGDPSLDNIRPISGRSSVTAYRAGVNQYDNPTSVTLSLGQTVYGCTVGLVSGVLTIDTAIITVTTCSNASANYSMYKLGDLDSIKTSSSDISACNVLTHFFGAPSTMPEGQYHLVNSEVRNGAYVYFCFAGCRGSTQTATRNNNRNKLTELQNAGTPMQLVYTLAEPIVVQLTQTQIEMLMRNNTVWSDAGVVTLNYARIRT